MKIKSCIVFILMICLFLASCQETKEKATPDILDITSIGEPYDISVESEESNELSEEESTVTQQAYIEVMREGEISIIPVETAKGTAGKYTIAYDPKYFVFVPEGNVDRFIYEEWDDEQSVYYNVSICNTDTKGFVTDIITKNGEPYDTFETVIGNHKTVAIYFASEDYYLHFYIIDCGNTTYIIETQFVLEMYEGLYAIMLELFDTFTIIE